MILGPVAEFLDSQHYARVVLRGGALRAALQFVAGTRGGGLKRNPGAWLRDRLLDRLLETGLLGMTGIGWFLGAGCVLWVTHGPGPAVPEWMAWSMLLPAALFLGAALFKARRGWRLEDMRKGAGAEERIGQAVEYALTGQGCAVAHHVEDVAEVGDIDHLVATPRGLWVIETKHGRVPEREFPETLRRIALNVAGVRKWAPAGVRVTGCLVFAVEPKKRPKPTRKQGAETIRVFANPETLAGKLRDEARAKGGDRSLARKVWRLGKVEPEPRAAEQARERWTRSRQ